MIAENIIPLVVDDSSTMVRIISNTLKRIGIKKVYTASDGVEGLKEFNSNKDISIVLTDWNMPNMNGLDLVKAIRKKDEDIPIVMITTEGGKAEVITALKAGASQYIVKPFDIHTLKIKLQNILDIIKRINYRNF